MPQRHAPQHPVFRIVRVEQGRSMVWLARETGFSHGYVRRVASGGEKGSPRFRAACAVLLGMPESALFLAGGDVDHGASGAPKRRVSREGSAVREVYARSMTASSDAAGGAVA